VPIVVLAGLALTGLSLAMYLHPPALLRPFMALSCDVMIRRAAEEPKSGRVAIVDIDSPSLERIGQWPWPRHRLAVLVRQLARSAAAVVAFDVIFAEKDRLSPHSVTEDMKRYFDADVSWGGMSTNLMDFDRMFVRELREVPSILGCLLHPSLEHTAASDETCPGFRSRVFMRGKGDPVPWMQQARGVDLSLPFIEERLSIGAVNALADADLVVRRAPMVWALGDRVYPALSLEALRLYAGREQSRVDYDERGGLARVVVGDLSFPVDRCGSAVINFRRIVEGRPGSGFVCSFPTHCAADVIDGKVPKEAFAGKIVLVGTSVPGLRDLRATPMTPVFSGVEVHATIIDNVLAGDVLFEPGTLVAVHAVLIGLVGCLLTVLLHRSSAWIGLCVALGTILLSVGAGFALLVAKHVVFDPSWLVITVVIEYPLLTVIRFWETERQRRIVRSMFATMVSPKVLHYLESNPDSFSLTGRKVDASVLFSDIKGFTAISETLPPDRLSTLLNKYLSPMTTIILERDGYVDKYRGDAIMAEWGVPYPLKNHAVQACFSALEQQARLAELRPFLREEFGCDVYVRMGINSGEMTAGHMGSDQHFDYTVLGDAVNLASRLEPVNRDYGTEIIIGGDTFERARDEIEARLLDRIVVKGKSHPVHVYELLGRAGELDDDRRRLREIYERALHLHWERRWEDSLACLDEALNVVPDDAPSRVLRTRVEEYRRTPPPDGWEGEYVRDEKD